MDSIQISSVSELIKYYKELPLNNSSFCFRGQSNFSWTLQPTIYRYENFMRYQTLILETNLLKKKPKNALPPLTFTDSDLEWLMLSQHYGVPTRLLDWSTDILVSLFFACHEEDQFNSDGALFICNQDEYNTCSTYQSTMHIQKLHFIRPNIGNPRLQAQSGCFMIWGHSPLNSNISKESYDLYQYHKSTSKSYFLKKLLIPKNRKSFILDELKQSKISFESLYYPNGYNDQKLSSEFKSIKEEIRILSILQTDSKRLTNSERILANSSGIDTTDMFHNCVSLKQIIYK